MTTTKKPTLLILAAGMGSRYGGLKQLDSVGPSGEVILDYSVFDAINAGFDRVVFIIRRDFEEAFREKIVTKYEGKIKVDLVFQDFDDLPPGCSVPEGRVKPWGTTHAIRAARKVIDAPFAVINADDFYGTDAFMQLGKYLANLDVDQKPLPFAMVGYRMDQTLSDNGSVARGVCQVNDAALLTDIREMTKIARDDDGVIRNKETDTPDIIADDTRVSMNLWGFTPALFDGMEERFSTWFEANKANLKSEWFIPFYVDELLKEGTASVTVLPTDSRWFGVTYQEDKPIVVNAIQKMVDAGVYPAKLW